MNVKKRRTRDVIRTDPTIGVVASVPSVPQRWQRLLGAMSSGTGNSRDRRDTETRRGTATNEGEAAHA